ncbi:MAG: alpha/beta fold hydrolase [Hydrogenophaga sp.]|nr:alpha/beta fold hydrolase [Hydrogenophaga sp.]
MTRHDLIWERDGAHWPNSAHSRIVGSGGLRWHVQQFAAMDGPQAPCALLLHGTGSSTHSWRDLAPLLARRFEVLAPDLPGHAFTGLPAAGAQAPEMGLTGMAQAVHALLKALGRVPDLVVGHSAGAAVAIRMCLDGLIQPRRLAGLNPALLPLEGTAGRLFTPAARLLAGQAWVPRVFAWHARAPSVLGRLLESTGSRLDDQGVALYHRLVQSPAHARGALAMMASWDLPGLARDLCRLGVPLDLLVGACDRTVPPAQSRRVMAALPEAVRGRCVWLQGLGHLAHEEAPDLVAAHLLACWDGQPPPDSEVMA